MRLAPSAKAIEKTSTGTIALSAAARKAFDGTSAVTHCAPDGRPIRPRYAARSAADVACSIAGA